MKNKITALCVLLFCIYISVNAQQKYESCFGKESTKWIFVQPTSVWGMEVEFSPSYYTIDTIKCYGTYVNTRPFGVVYYETDNNSKLWRWDTEINKKSIIMDLNWKVGDFIYIDTEAFKEKYSERPYAIVDSVYLDMNNREVILTDLVLDLDTTHFRLKYTEGIGPNASVFIFDDIGMFWGMSELLLCAYKDEVLSYTNTEAGGECKYTEPVSAQTIKTTAEVIVSFHSNIIDLIFEDTFSGKLCLITPEGKVIKKVDITKNNKSINIGDLSDGIYLIQITSRTGTYCTTQKIFKIKSR